jgi:hypothetical protein
MQSPGKKATKRKCSMYYVMNCDYRAMCVRILHSDHAVLRTALSRGRRTCHGAGASDRRDGCLCQASESCTGQRTAADGTLQLEYDNIEGMILLSELSRRRIRSIQKLIRVGRNEVVVVLRVDREKGTSTRTRTQPRLHASPLQGTSISRNAACRPKTSPSAKNAT